MAIIKLDWTSAGEKGKIRDTSISFDKTIKGHARRARPNIAETNTQISMTLFLKHGQEICVSIY